MSTDVEAIRAEIRRIVWAMPSYGQVMREAAVDEPHPEPTQPAAEHVASAWERKMFLDAICGVNDFVFDLDPDGVMWQEA